MYLQFARFILPLSIAVVAFTFSSQVINSGLARAPRTVESLAAFALAWGIIEFFVGAIYPSRQVSLVLAADRYALRKILQFVVGMGLLAAAVVSGLVFTPAGSWVLQDVHGADAGLSAVVTHALAWMIPIPLLDGLVRTLSGVLMRLRRTEIVSVASMSEIGAMLVVVPVLLPTDIVQAQPDSTRHPCHLRRHRRPRRHSSVGVHYRCPSQTARGASAGFQRGRCRIRGRP